MKTNSKINIEVTHAMEEESGLVIAMTALGSLYVLGKEEMGNSNPSQNPIQSQSQNQIEKIAKIAKIATELGPEWFNGSSQDYNDYKEAVVSNSNNNLVKEINQSQVYQKQLWAVIHENIELKVNSQPTQDLYNYKRENVQSRYLRSQRSQKPTSKINLDFEVENI